MFEGKCLKAKCLKDGLRNGVEVSLPARLAHRLRQAPVCRWGGPGYQPVRLAAAANFGALGSLMQKARSGFSGAGSIVAMMKMYR
ncbi:hypothetical protein [Bradyrhizobium viridifuturi]|uniref:hypothetical protein n=1 Tax=Bradyrhizobium viridifuturi TaxID=1654716 RepID=UPI000FE14B4F|nr:hypothetical protein [Bradyrhizobium viridifuturi]